MTFEFYAIGPYSTEETKRRWHKKEEEVWKDVVEVHCVIKEGEK